MITLKFKRAANLLRGTLKFPFPCRALRKLN
jgi:hypothetical protein